MIEFKYRHSDETKRKISISHKKIYEKKRLLGIIPKANKKSIQRRNWALRNVEKTRLYNKRWSDLHPESVRDRGYRVRYGIGLSEYNRIFQIQGGMCGICGKHQSEITRRLCVDHSHINKKIRGLLCGPCNRFLGMFENIQWLNKAKFYLEKYGDIFVNN